MTDASLTAQEIWALELQKLERQLGPIAAGNWASGGPIVGGVCNDKPVAGKINPTLLRSARALHLEMRRLIRAAAPWVDRTIVDTTVAPTRALPTGLLSSKTTNKKR